MSEGAEARQEIEMADAGMEDDSARTTVRGDFDPGRYLTKVGQADYLEVKWRLVWLRDLYPDATVDTEMVRLDDVKQTAVFKATVAIPGGGRASGYGSESFSDFKEYMEKAETKAIGRALGALGFGTQFSYDFDFGSGAKNGQKVVDAPASPQPQRATNAPPRPQQGAPAGQQGQGEPRPGVNPANASAAPTEKQIKTLDMQIDAHGIDEIVSSGIRGMFGGKGRHDLTRSEMSLLIGKLMESPKGDVPWLVEFADTYDTLHDPTIPDAPPHAASTFADAPAPGAESWDEAKFAPVWLRNIQNAKTRTALDSINSTITKTFGLVPPTIGHALSARYAQIG